ncbi:MAG TPA: serine hydrolase domain-containing protein [Candidatus Bathyarchaeia archaeon]|nr:serine hydrolase domain-containing protein [Candidatus Bathyarchaeia archaeon]
MNRKSSRIVVPAVLLAAAFVPGAWLAASPQAAAAAPQRPAAASQGLDLPALDQFIADTMAAKGFVGLSVALMIDGKIVLAKSYGQAALDGPAANAETSFAIGSISKQFTCAAVLKLAEAGRLSVMDKVAKYYPELTRADDITLLDLMNHVSGYRDWYPLDFVDRPMSRPIEPDVLIRRFAGEGRKLDFEPGSRYSYSNTGFNILGRVVEKVSGQELGRFLSDEFFSPLGMRRTFYEPDPKLPNLASGYILFATSAPAPNTPEALHWVGGAGAIYSTAADLAAWDLALVTGKVLKPESYALMTKPRMLTDGRVSWYGCGLSVGYNNRRFVISHGGAVSGFQASNFAVPDTRSAAVLLSNAETGENGLIFDKLVAAILPAANVDVPKIAGPPAADVHRMMLASYQAGKVDRKLLGEEFSYWLNASRLQAASTALKPYGEPAKAVVESTNERGGMEVSIVRFTFADGSSLRGLMYRTPDGKIQQFFVSRA